MGSNNTLKGQERTRDAAAKVIQRWYRTLSNKTKRVSLLRYLEAVDVNPKPSQLQKQPSNELYSKLITLEIHLDDKIKTIALLEDSLDTMKRREKEAISKCQQEEKRKLAAQKKELEEAIGRHLQFIDTLLKDKASLSAKCEQLTNQMKTIQSSWEERVTK
jgi:hypothetical protein